MDKPRAVTLRLAPLLAASAAAGAANAHPHAEIDQQVLLSVGAGEVTVQVRIAPSYVDGAELFAHIDVDGDGLVSRSEASAFGWDVMSSAALSVDGERFELNVPRVFVPELEWVSAGLGVIEVDASAAINLTARSRHNVDFRMSYDDLAHEWFIQPFYFPDLIRLLPSRSFERSPSGDSVAIVLAP